MTCDLKRRKLSLRIVRFVRTAADVNRDGIVNIFDLILVAAHFGEQYGPAAAPIVIKRTHTQPDVELRMVDEE